MKLPSLDKLTGAPEQENLEAEIRAQMFERIYLEYVGRERNKRHA
jgi:hypothetical protein